MFKFLKSLEFLRKKRNKKRKGNIKPEENSKTKKKKTKRKKRKPTYRHVNGSAPRRAHMDGARFRPARRSIGIIVC
jgi:hypothetical protein